MFCGKCGAPIKDGNSFCTACGASVEENPRQEQSKETLYANPIQPAPVSPYGTDNPYKENNLTDNPWENTSPTMPYAEAGSILTKGILSLCFGCTVFLSFIGIIMAGLAISRANLYLNQGIQLPPKAKVGRILAKVGLPVSIVLTAYIFILVIISLI